MSEVVKNYSLGGNSYTQSQLVLGQIRQLAALLKGISFRPAADSLELINSLGDKVPQALAIVLNPAGVKLKDKDLAALAAEIEISISFDQTCEVVEDFFDCNPIVSLLEKLTGTFSNLRTKLPLTTLSENLSAFSPAETSPEGTTSSGDIPLENASLT